MEHGYAGIRDVRKAPPKHDDTQQSFFLAETLKYLYLMFGSNEEVSLDEWVFNTEAHPLRIVQVKAPIDVAGNKVATTTAGDRPPNELNRAPLLVGQTSADKVPVELDARTD